MRLIRWLCVRVVTLGVPTRNVWKGRRAPCRLILVTPMRVATTRWRMLIGTTWRNVCRVSLRLSLVMDLVRRDV